MGNARKAAELSGEDPEALFDFSQLVSHLPWRREWAGELLRRVIAGESNNADAHLFLGVLLEGKAPEDSAHHLGLARKHLPRPPGDFDAWVNNLRERWVTIPGAAAVILELVERFWPI